MKAFLSLSLPSRLFRTSLNLNLRVQACLQRCVAGQKKSFQRVFLSQNVNGGMFLSRTGIRLFPMSHCQCVGLKRKSAVDLVVF